MESLKRALTNSLIWPWENSWSHGAARYYWSYRHHNIYADCSACYDNINSPCPDRSVPRGARLGHVTRALVTRPCTRTWSTERATGGRRKSDSALFKIASSIRRGDNCVKFLFLEQKLWYRLSRLILVLFLAKGESRTHKKPMIRFALLSPSFSSFFSPKPPSTCFKVPQSVPWDAPSCHEITSSRSWTKLQKSYNLKVTMVCTVCQAYRHMQGQLLLFSSFEIWNQ